MNSGSAGSLRRCGWARTDLAVAYHDTEWGVPQHDDRILFEFLILESAQAGLSWETILKKRDNFRKAFDYFDPAVVAKYGEHKIARLMADPGIIRNRMKIEAAIQNARAFETVQEEFGSFNAYVWQFVCEEPIRNAWTRLEEIPSRTPESETMSKALKARNFKFVGPTICYAFMQAVGLVNDHLVYCFRYNEIVR